MEGQRGQSASLSYLSLLSDEKARMVHGGTISQTGREPHSALNGNLQLQVPDIDNAEVFKHLSPCMQVNTNTRTIFHNEWKDHHDTIFDKVSSPKALPASAIKRPGHVGMDTLVVGDPRQHHGKSNLRPDVGPGTYPTHLPWQTTGIVVAEEGTLPRRSHMWDPEKDASRQSATFKSPERCATLEALALERQSTGTPTYHYNGDQKVWTAKGMYIARGTFVRSFRDIRAELWGRNLREPSGVGQELSSKDVTYPDPHMRVHAFGSRTPRLVAVANASNDTRVQPRNYEVAAGTPTHLGPGSFNTEMPRFKSWHAANQSVPVYITLANHSPHYTKGKDEEEQPQSPTSPSRQLAMATPAGSARNRTAVSLGIITPTSDALSTHHSGHAGTQPGSPLRREGTSMLECPSPLSPVLLRLFLPLSRTTSAPLPPLSTPALSESSSPSRDAVHSSGGPHARQNVVSLNSTYTDQEEAGPDLRGLPNSSAEASNWPPSTAADLKLNLDVLKEVLDPNPAVDRDWAAHQAVVQATFLPSQLFRGAVTLATTPSRTLSPAAGTPLPSRSSHRPASLIIDGIDESEHVGLTTVGPGQSRLPSPATSMRYCASAPASPQWQALPSPPWDPTSVASPPSMDSDIQALLHAQHLLQRQQYDKLVFLRRAVPHKQQVKGRLRAIAELRSARQKLGSDM